MAEFYENRCSRKMSQGLHKMVLSLALSFPLTRLKLVSIKLALHNQVIGWVSVEGGTIYQSNRGGTIYQLRRGGTIYQSRRGGTIHQSKRGESLWRRGGFIPGVQRSIIHTLFPGASLIYLKQPGVR